MSTTAVEPHEIASSRGKALGLLALSLGFVAIALFVPADDGDQTWRWLCGGFFGLCAIAFVALIVRPQRVVLDGGGFTVSGGLARSPRHVAWRDVDRFFAYRLPRGGRMVGYELAVHARPDTYMGDLARRWGADGVLPKTLAESPETIADRFNAYRAAALGR